MSSSTERRNRSGASSSARRGSRTSATMWRSSVDLRASRSWFAKAVCSRPRSTPNSRTTHGFTSGSSSWCGRRRVSGHSKWSSIKHKKGAADAKRGQLFSKLTRAIIVAARDGGPDPDANATLATAIQKARDNSMPTDNIERAIARGSGSATEGESYETVTYEGYGDGGVAVFVEALTDNRNRTAAEVRHIFAKHDGNLGTSGAVAWLFERKGVVMVPGTVDEDELMLAAADGGADDVEPDGSR